MFKSVASLIALAWMVAPAIAATTSVCKVCSTTATAYNVQLKTTVYTSSIETYYDPSTATKTVTSGTRTMYRPKATTTITVTIRQSYYYNSYVTQLRTTSVSFFNPTTTTVCATSTPSDYPTPIYCDCASTSTTTVDLPVTVSSFEFHYGYNKTRTVQPTSYGTTITSTSYIEVETTFPTISYLDFTKTFYAGTVTKTRQPYNTPSSKATFKLEVINNPYYQGSPYLQAECYETDGCDDTYPYYVYTYGTKPSEGTDFSIVDGVLYDSTNNVSCGYTQEYARQLYYGMGPYITPYTLMCGVGFDNTTLIPAEVNIDCLGNLFAYEGNATTWTTYQSGGSVSLWPMPDPVHGYNDSGSSNYYGQEYISLKVR